MKTIKVNIIEDNGLTIPDFLMLKSLLQKEIHELELESQYTEEHFVKKECEKGIVVYKVILNKINNKLGYKNE